MWTWAPVRARASVVASTRSRGSRRRRPISWRALYLGCSSSSSSPPLAAFSSACDVFVRSLASLRARSRRRRIEGELHGRRTVHMYGDERLPAVREPALDALVRLDAAHPWRAPDPLHGAEIRQLGAHVVLEHVADHDHPHDAPFAPVHEDRQRAAVREVSRCTSRTRGGHRVATRTPNRLPSSWSIELSSAVAWGQEDRSPPHAASTIDTQTTANCARTGLIFLIPLRGAGEYSAVDCVPIPVLGGHGCDHISIDCCWRLA